MDSIKDVVDYLSTDWVYWKSEYLRIRKRFDELNEKFAKMEKELNLERQRIKIEELNIKLLKDRMNKINPSISPAGKVHHMASSSNEFESNSSSVKSGSDRIHLFESFFLLSSDTDDSIFTYFPFETIQNISTEVLLNFIFNEPITETSVNSLQDLFSILYPKIYRDKNSFIFTIKGLGTETKSAKIPNRDLLYGCCVKLSDIHPRSQLSVQVCYCILTYVPCFDLHFEVLYKIIEISRTERINEIMKPEHLFDDFESLLDIASEKFLSNEAQFVLQSFANYTIQPLLSIRIDITESQSIEYEFPSDLSMIDTLWPCIVTFSILSLDQIIQCLSCLLQEYSVVFKSSNPAYLSSCVLGLHSLIRPFKWNFIITPILPEQISEIIASDLPVLAGVTYDIGKFDKKGLLVDLGCGLLTDFQVDLPDFEKLKESCKADYDKIYGKGMFVHNQGQEIACYRIIMQIRRFLQEIAERFGDVGKFDRNKVNAVIGKSLELEKSFLMRFSKTQIFHDYFYENY